MMAFRGQCDGGGGVGAGWPSVTEMRSPLR